MHVHTRDMVSINAYARVRIYILVELRVTVQRYRAMCFSCRSLEFRGNLAVSLLSASSGILGLTPSGPWPKMEHPRPAVVTGSLPKGEVKKSPPMRQHRGAQKSNRSEMYQSIWACLP